MNKVEKEMSHKIYPIGIQNFEKIRKDGYAYVDKTALVYQLVKSGSYYFLNRPRRFGKSLLISTLEAYFRGKRDLFEGLAMEALEQDWVNRPVLHLDLNMGKYDAPDSLEKALSQAISLWEKIYGTDIAESTLSLRFAGVIRRACEQTGHRVAILVDEYDKPLLQAIDNADLQLEYRNVLKSFYGVLKTMDDSIMFALLTGVTKFGKCSIFSDLNNLNDISMDDQFVALCGITEKELHANFEEELHELAKEQEVTYEAACKELKERYGGYHFAENTEDVYNPFSPLSAFRKMKFGSYWFVTGTPAYLVNWLKRSHYDLQRLAFEEATSDALNSIDGDEQFIPIIFQSGYLTIKSYDKELGLYRLTFPNREVEEGFLKSLMPFYIRFNKLEAPLEIQRFVSEMEKGQPDAFFHRLQSFFTDTTDEWAKDLEARYKSVLFIVFKLVGFCAQTEYHTSDGCIDLVVKTPNYIYIMEFNLNGTAEEALRQIEERKYARPFEGDPRKRFKIGVSFSKKLRNVERWIVE